MGNCKTQNKCECGWIGDDDELRHETVSDPYCTGDSWFSVTESFCPKCGDDGLEEVTMCLSCLEVEAEEGYDDCRKCRDAELEEEIVGFVQKDAKYVEEMNGYAVHWNGELVTGQSPRDLVDQIIEGENSA